MLFGRITAWSFAHKFCGKHIQPSSYPSIVISLSPALGFIIDPSASKFYATNWVCLIGSAYLNGGTSKSLSVTQRGLSKCITWASYQCAVQDAGSVTSFQACQSLNCIHHCSKLLASSLRRTCTTSGLFVSSSSQ